MVHWAPLNVPLERRLQTASVLVWANAIPIACILFTCFFFSPLFPLCIIYLIWLAFFDSSPRQGGRRMQFIRNLPIWRYARSYFPISLHVEDASLFRKHQSYLFGIHPHGIIAVGAFINFATDANGVQEKLPIGDIHLATLGGNFRIPLLRDIWLGCGLVDVSKKSCDFVLSQPASSLMIVVGGAEEALDARPGTYDLVLHKRRGFIKLAMEHGVPLVPVFSFGETDLWDQLPNPEGSRLRKFQDLFKRLFGFSPPLLKGRGIFNYDYGLLPYRKPIRTVVGKPIDVPKSSNPTTEEIDALHRSYAGQLKEIFDRHKNEFARNRTRSIAFVK
mmetsp:Transcript_13331/g.21866  ORF Transcript_13331/g.21866 Transcript_13331/m.21866 type:complete len:332 (+) Transcript_13331:80-1075(+)